MESFERAIAAAESMRALTEAEVARAQGERALIRDFDVDGLFKRAQARAEFNEKLGLLEKTLHDDLVTVGRVLGIEDVTMERLSGAAPAPARRLAAVFSELRALASALSELDELNRKLLQKSLACVRGYLGALLPGSVGGYDRRGAVSALPSATFSGRV